MLKVFFMYKLSSNSSRTVYARYSVKSRRRRAGGLSYKKGLVCGVESKAKAAGRAADVLSVTSRTTRRADG